MGRPAADPVELALAYADLFLLNVYPYGTAFTDPSGELNGPAARRVVALYQAHGYCPSELNLVGAPDHLGLCIGFLASGGHTVILPYLLDWAPVCCLAVERDPSTHPFYRALAALTRDHLLAEVSKFNISNPTGALRSLHVKRPISTSEIQNPKSEIGLLDVVRFFLAPARCGIFLSRSRMGQMARALGAGLPFSSRFEVAEMLFAAAGESEHVAELLHALDAEIEQWAAAYRAWAAEYTAWQPCAARWLGRIEGARQMLDGMREVLASPPELETDATYFG